MRKICTVEGMPDITTIIDWAFNHKEFSQLYAKAREMQAELMADDITDIADDSSEDFGFTSSSDKDGEGAKPVFLKENVLRSKLRVDARKWVAAKLLPKKFGDFQKVEHAGEVKGTIAVTVVNFGTQVKPKPGESA